MEKKQIRTIFLFQFKLGQKLLKQLAISTKRLAQEPLLNTQHKGGLRNFAAAMRVLKMKSVVVGHWMLKTIN